MSSGGQGNFTSMSSYSHILSSDPGSEWRSEFNVRKGQVPPFLDLREWGTGKELGFGFDVVLIPL